MPITHLIKTFKMAVNSHKVFTFDDFLMGVNWVSWNFPSITAYLDFATLKESICETHVLHWMYTRKIKGFNFNHDSCLLWLKWRAQFGFSMTSSLKEEKIQWRAVMLSLAHFTHNWLTASQEMMRTFRKNILPIVSVGPCHGEVWGTVELWCHTLNSIEIWVFICNS